MSFGYWGIHTAADWTPPHSSSLPSVGHCGNNEWGEGLCGHLALAFKNMYPDMKIGAEIDDKDGTVNHAWAYGEDGRAHDYQGTHDDNQAYGPAFHNSHIDMDVDPRDLADNMGIDYNPDDDRQWENHEVAQAGHLINRHWLGDDSYEGDDGYYDPEQAEDRGRPHTASTNGIRYAQVVEADVAEDLILLRLGAAVGEDLLNSLHDEFHQWWHESGNAEKYSWAGDFNGRGPISQWKHVESFMAKKYPAAHRQFYQGLEQAGDLLTNPQYYDQSKHYKTGPEAVSRYGYDPKEIVSGMLLLHNRSHPHRNDLEDADQDRLSEIARIRSQQQRAYDTAHLGARNARLAMPAPMPEGITFHHHPTDDTIPTEPWAGSPESTVMVNKFSAPAVEARHNGKTVGYLEYSPSLSVNGMSWSEYGNHPPEIGMIKVRRGYQRHGIGTALFDFARQHEPDLQHSDARTGLGDKWMAYEQSRNARLAMAWDQWAPQVQGGCKTCTHKDDGNGSHGEYWIEHEPTGGPLPGDALAGGKMLSNLSFFHDVGRDGVPELYIAGIHTSSGHRNDGVAESLIRRMHEDHPGTRINPGFMTDDGEAFHDRMRSRTAMPAPLPQGVHFRYHPELMWSPGVTAHYKGKQIGSLEWYDDDHVMVDLGSRKPGEIDRISVHPDHQGNSVASSMFDFAKQHEPRLHHSEQLTDDGRGWSEYEQSRNARLAMAWDEWAPQIKHQYDDSSKITHPRGRYSISHEDGSVIPEGYAPMESDLTYQHEPENKMLYVDIIKTHPGFEGQGIAESLIRRLHQDYPDHKIDPGGMTVEGEGFMNRMLSKEPGARDVLAGLHGDLPEGITFRYHEPGFTPFPDVIMPTVPVSNSSPMVSAHDGDRMIGHIQWRADGHPRRNNEIWDLRVHPDYQRRGVATALFDWVTDKINPDLKHSTNLSDEGRAFAEAEDARPLAQERYEAWSNDQPMPKRFAGMNGELPPLTFEPFNSKWSNGIMARHALDGRPVGHLHWHPDGEIDTIEVHEELRRRGIGSAMLAEAQSDPDTYPSTWPIHHSNHLTKDGQAFAAAHDHFPEPGELIPSKSSPEQWGDRAVEEYIPLNIPYTGQNEAEMSEHLERPWTPPTHTASTDDDDGWPVWWRGRSRPGIPWDKRWNPNHPQHTPAPWDH